MAITETIIKKEIKNLKRIKDTFDERFGYLRLDKNERLLPFTAAQLDDFRSRITSESLSGYSEIGPFYRRLAEYLGVKDNQLLLASGSDLAIKSIFEACIKPGSHVVLHAPCYAMYKVYSNMFGAEVTLIPVGTDWQPDIEKMLAAVRPETVFMALENPNGFVGTAASLDVIEHCAAELFKRNVLLVIDEAYYYVEHSKSALIPLIAKYPNIVLSQTFSKGHGLAGCRMGYLIGEADLIEHISRVRPMHEITSLTCIAAQWVLDHPEMLEQFQKENLSSKTYLKTELNALGVDYKDTLANFMLLYLPNEGKTREIALKMRERKVLIRRPFEEPYLKGWARVCVGSVADSRQFIACLKAILS